jgi:lysophospholipase L1-like esterase
VASNTGEENVLRAAATFHRIAAMPTQQFFKTFRAFHPVLAASFLAASLAGAAEEWHFRFNDLAPAATGSTRVAAGLKYDDQRGYGFAQQAGEAPVFALKVPEGNYTVTVLLGDAKKASSTTVRAESRRLMLHDAAAEAGKLLERSFTVNVKKPAIPGGGAAGIDSREAGPPAVPNWDDWLTLEFTGKQPAVAAVSIKPAGKTATVFLAGDSTVTDQASGPYFGWGQMLPRFFKPSVAFSNHAQSGLALHSFERQKRLAKALSMMNKGDYLFIQFGHNDQKDKTEGAGPFTSYKANLKKYIAAARKRGAIPVLVTPMERRRWNGTEQGATLQDYAEAVRQAGAEEGAPVIDLNQMSLKLYAALGPEGSTKAFVHYPENTFPGQTKALKDDTHHNAFGGYELARCMVEGIRKALPELAKELAPDAGNFDPNRPDKPEDILIPLGNATAEKPAGS